MSRCYHNPVYPACGWAYSAFCVSRFDTDAARCDVVLLIVADNRTLVALYAALATAEAKLAHAIAPTLDTSHEILAAQAKCNAYPTRFHSGTCTNLCSAEQPRLSHMKMFS